MLLKGLQKLTLLDFPGKMAATVFTAWLICPLRAMSICVTGTPLSSCLPEDTVHEAYPGQHSIEKLSLHGNSLRRHDPNQVNEKTDPFCFSVGVEV